MPRGRKNYAGPGRSGNMGLMDRLVGGQGSRGESADYIELDIEDFEASSTETGTQVHVAKISSQRDVAPIKDAIYDGDIVIADIAPRATVTGRWSASAPNSSKPPRRSAATSSRRTTTSSLSPPQGPRSAVSVSASRRVEPTLRATVPASRLRVPYCSRLGRYTGVSESRRAQARDRAGR